jgi:hypothetical protein
MRKDSTRPLASVDGHEPGEFPVHRAGTGDETVGADDDPLPAPIVDFIATCT